MALVRPSFPRAAAALLALGVLSAFAVAGAGSPRQAREDLANGGALDSPDAYGRLTVKDYPVVGNRPARSWVRLQAWKLERGEDFTMYLDDPTVEGDDFQPWGDSIAARGNGNINFRVDTKKGGALPFGKTADELAGAQFQLRDGEGNIVLTGVFPTLPPVEPPVE